MVYAELGFESVLRTAFRRGHDSSVVHEDISSVGLAEYPLCSCSNRIQCIEFHLDHDYLRLVGFVVRQDRIHDFLPLSKFRTVRNSFAPVACKVRAVSLPIPEDPPVMTMTLSAN